MGVGHSQESAPVIDKDCIRILQTGMHDNHGGVESFILNYSQVLKAKGVVFDYIDLQGKGISESDKILSEGSKIYTMRDYRKHPISTIKRIKEILRTENYVCIHINMLSAASLVPVIGGLLGKAKVLVHSHNSQALGLHRRALHAVNAKILRWLPVTRVACGKLAGDWMFGQKYYEVIPNSVDIDRYRFQTEDRALLRSKLHINEDTFVMGFVGRVSPQKNPAYLPRILNAVKKKGMKNVKLLIIGDGELLEQVKESAQAFGVSKDIIYVGSQRNMGKWYSAMDVCLLPSLWEGLPLVGVEAQTSGLPCFFSDQVTDEVALTDLVNFCELTETAENWASAIIEKQYDLSQRHRYAECIGQTDYFIGKSAEHLYAIYRSLE